MSKINNVTFAFTGIYDNGRYWIRTSDLTGVIRLACDMSLRNGLLSLYMMIV